MTPLRRVLKSFLKRAHWSRGGYSVRKGRVIERIRKGVQRSRGEFGRGCNGETADGVFGCRFGGRPLGVPLGVKIFLSVERNTVPIIVPSVADLSS